MNWLNKLFSGTGRNANARKERKANFTASDEMMDEDAFWKIIERSKNFAGRNFEAQQEALANELRKLSPNMIIHFYNRFRYFRGRANTWELWGAIYIIHGGCGDDSFNDFREWMIGQGREFYYKTVADPGSLITINVDEIELEWEGLGYVPGSVFEELTEDEIPAVYQEQFETTGKEWNEDSDDLKKMFPLLWAKYLGNH